MPKLTKVNKTPSLEMVLLSQVHPTKQPTMEEQPANNAQADKGKQDSIPRDGTAQPRSSN